MQTKALRRTLPRNARPYYKHFTFVKAQDKKARHESAGHVHYGSPAPSKRRRKLCSLPQLLHHLLQHFPSRPHH